MSCNTCQSKFTLFTRENGCPNCGFSYCSKCIKYKCNLPNGQTKKVCGPCYNKLRSTATNSMSTGSSGVTSPDVDQQQPLAPVDIANKLAALENPAKPPIVIYKPSGQWENFKAGLEPADQVIVDRLKKLKDSDKHGPPPSTEEIRRRLAILKDQDPDASQCSINVNKPDLRTDKEKEDDLIRQYMENLELSSGSDPSKEVEERLNALKGLDPSKQYSTIPPDMDEETITKNIIKKALAEAALEAKYEAEELEPMEVERPAASSEDEISCCMCEQTAGLFRCAGCTGDLYCEVCFEDNHDDFEMGKHKRVPIDRRTTANPD